MITGEGEINILGMTRWLHEEKVRDINDKVLLYSKGNYIQYLVREIKGKKEKERVYGTGS